jgi:two-component system response regulator AtoC
VTTRRRKPSVAEGESRERAPRVLVVDDAEGIRTFLANLFELKGFEVDTAEDGRSALALLEGGADPDVVLLDVMMPGMDGLQVLRRIRELDLELPVVMLSVVGKANTIVEAMQLGASDYLNKPFEAEELEATLRDVFERRRLRQERERLLAEIGDPDASVVWQSPAMEAIRERIEHIADTDVTVLIQGESGVGKEVVARAIHDRSNRKTRPFVKVNCAALPADLLESELFGYERGAFTGAAARKAGKFETAHTGTIFLDEIGEMSPALQAKLLQVLQDSEFTRLGGNRDIRVDVRVVCATNRELEAMVRARTFREDLYYRLNVVTLQVPPLRERMDELPALVATFLTRYARKYGKPQPRLGARLMRAFERHSFPGNVRELENLIKRIVVLGGEESVLEHLASTQHGVRNAGNLQRWLEEVEQDPGSIPLREVGRRAALEAEREAIERVLLHTRWNRKQASRLLGVSYKTLLQKIRECGLEAED